jgi:hypothetical protein
MRFFISSLMGFVSNFRWVSALGISFSFLGFGRRREISFNSFALPYSL